MSTAGNEVRVQLRFAPDGTVADISHRPQWASPQAWYELLTNSGDHHYEIFAAGRATFRLSADELATLTTRH